MKRIMILSMVLLSTLAGAQEVISLQTLTDSALQRNPDLQKLQWEIRRAETMNRAYNGIGPANVSYMQGQINYVGSDYQWQINQPLGNPLSGLANTQVREARINTAQLEYELNQAWVIMEIEKAYAGWQSWYGVREIRATLRETYEAALKVAEKQAAIGDIDQTSLGLARGRYAESVQAENDALQQQLMYVYQLEVLTQGSLAGYQPENTGNAPVIQQSGADSSALFNEYYLSRVNLARENKDLSGSRFFPSFSVGYFNQELEGNPGFDGFTIGASIPLFDVSTYQDRQRAKIDLTQSQIEADQGLWQRERKLAQLDVQRSEILQQMSRLPEEDGKTTSNLEIARKKYELGDIDMLVLSQTLNALSADRISRLQLLLRLRQIEAEINYLNTK